MREKVLFKHFSIFEPATKEGTKPLSFGATFIDMAQIKTISVTHC